MSEAKSLNKLSMMKKEAKLRKKKENPSRFSATEKLLKNIPTYREKGKTTIQKSIEN